MNRHTFTRFSRFLPSNSALRARRQDTNFTAPAHRHPSVIEPLEGRIAPAVTLVAGLLLVTGDDPGSGVIDDTITISVNGANIQVVQNGGAPVVNPAASVTRISVDGRSGNDTFTLDFAGGNVLGVAPNGRPIFYDGGSGINAFNLINGTETADTHTVGPAAGQGSISLTVGGATSPITYDHVTPVNDFLTGPLTIAGTNSSDDISYTQGFQDNGVTPEPTRGLVAVNAVNSVQFTNKTTLTLNGRAGDDTISLSNSSKPTGLTGITVDAGNPTASDTLIVNGIAGGGAATLDQLLVTPTGTGSGTVSETAGAGATAIANFVTVTFSNVEHLTLVGQSAELDQIATTGTAGNDTFELTFGTTTDSGDLTGFSTGATPFQFVPIHYEGILGLVVPPFAGGGSDTLIANGTSADDTFSFAATSPPGSVGGPFQTVQLTTGGKTYTPVLYSSAVTQVILRGLAGNDTFNVDLDPVTGTTSIAIRVEGGNSDASSDILNYFARADATTTIDLGASTITSSVQAANPVSYTGIETINETSTGASSALVVTGTAGDDTINVTPTGAGTGSFVRLGVGGSPLFTYTGIGAASGLTVNGGTGGTDVLGILGTEGADVVTSTATTVTSNGGVVTIGAGLDRADISTFGGDDSISINTTLVAIADGGAGNDLINGGGPSRRTLIGGTGDDALFGGTGADRLEGGEGADVLVGGPGDDLAFGGAGSDTFVWNPGDADDLIEGDAGDDRLAFAGANGTDTYTIAGDNGRVLFNRQPGNVGINMGGVENIISNSETIALSGRNEVPANNTTSSGFANFTYDATTGLFDLRIFVTGLTAANILDSHIHVNIPGSNGAVVVPIGGGAGYAVVGGGVERTATGLSLADIVPPPGFTAQQVLMEILLGRAYFNVHSPSFPGGEIRGNIIVSSPTAGSGGGDTLTVRDTTGTSLRSIVFDAGNEAEIRNGTALVDTVTIEGLNTADHLVAGVASAEDNNYVVTGLPYSILVTSSDGAAASGALRDQLILNGNGGDDTLEGLSSLESVTRLTLNGGAGSDSLIGTPGDDTMDGGAGDDTFIGSGGTDAVSGGAGSSVGDTILIPGTDGGDALNLTLNASEHLLATVNGVTTTYTNSVGGAISTSGIERLKADGLDGIDALTVDSTNGAVPIPISFDGGASTDALKLTGGTATADTYTPGSNLGDGTSTIVIGGVTQTVSFTSLAPVLDLVAGPLIVNGTNAANAINYTEGAITDNGLVSIDGHEAIEFSNKTTLTINGLAGSDTININNSFIPTGLTDIFVNAGDPTASDELIINAQAGIFDALVLEPTATGAGTVTDFTNLPDVPLPDVTFTGVEHLTLVGQEADGDASGVDGTDGDDQLHYFAGPTPDSGTVIGSMDLDDDTGFGPFALVPVTFTGMDQFSSLGYNLFGQVGGEDSFIYEGTVGVDGINVTAAGPDSVFIDHFSQGLRFASLLVGNVVELEIRSLDGDDGIQVNGPVDPTLFLDGGNASGDDVFYYLGGGGPVTANLDGTLVLEAGFAPMFYVGMERVSVDSGTADLSVIGTASGDVATITPGIGSLAVRIESPKITLDAETQGFLDVDLGAGNDSLTFEGTDLADFFSYIGTDTTTGSLFLNLFNPVSYIRVERTTLAGLAGDDLFFVASDLGAVEVKGGEGSDTVDFFGATSGVVIDLDLLNVDQQVNVTGEIVRLGDVIENFSGTDFDDLVFADAATFSRFFFGGLHTAFPPGDKLSFDGRGQIVKVVPVDTDTGTIQTKTLADSFYDEFETVKITNSPSSGGFGTPGNSNAFSTADIYDLTHFKNGIKPAPGKTPTAVATGDLNGDGFDDIVVVNTKSKNLSILINKGDGTFFDAVNIFSGGKAPRDIVIGDFDAVVGLDLVVSNPGSSNIAFFSGNNNGTFDAPTATVTTKFKPYALVVEDMDLNGTLDVVATSAATSAVQVLFGSGLGGFAASTPVSTVGKKPVDIVVADFNFDGFVDVATANFGSKNISLLKGGPGGALGAATLFTAGTGPTGLAVGDLDNDGNLDLAVSNRASRYVSVLLGMGGTLFVPQFEPQLQVAVPGRHESTSIVIADFDGDGHSDLGLGNNSGTNFTILLGLGAAVFTQPYEFDLGKTPPYFPTGGIAVADFNNDGLLDFVATNTNTSDISVLIRNI